MYLIEFIYSLARISTFGLFVFMVTKIICNKKFDNYFDESSCSDDDENDFVIIGEKHKKCMTELLENTNTQQ